jgi:hypothetical protein
MDEHMQSPDDEPIKDQKPSPVDVIAQQYAVFADDAAVKFGVPPEDLLPIIKIVADKFGEPTWLDRASMNRGAVSSTRAIPCKVMKT